MRLEFSAFPLSSPVTSSTQHGGWSPTMGHISDDHFFALERELADIEPSVVDRGLRHYPCSVELIDGRCLNAVYVITEVDAGSSSPLGPRGTLEGPRWIKPGSRDGLLRALCSTPKFAAQQIRRRSLAWATGYSRSCSHGGVGAHISSVDGPSISKGKSARNVTSVTPHVGKRDVSLTSNFQPHQCLLKRDTE